MPLGDATTARQQIAFRAEVGDRGTKTRVPLIDGENRLVCHCLSQAVWSVGNRHYCFPSNLWSIACRYGFWSLLCEMCRNEDTNVRNTPHKKTA